MNPRSEPATTNTGRRHSPRTLGTNKLRHRAWSASLAGATALLTVGAPASWATTPAAQPRVMTITNTAPQTAHQQLATPGHTTNATPPTTTSTTPATTNNTKPSQTSTSTATGPKSAAPLRCPRDTGRAAVRLELPQGPTLTETSGLQATVTVRNQTSQTWTSGTLQLNLTSKPFTTRDRLDAWLGGRAEPIDPIATLDLPQQLAPGHDFTTTVSLTADQLAQQWQPPTWGAYGVSVEVSDGTTVHHSARSAVIGEAQGAGAPQVPVVVIAPLTAGKPDLLLGGTTPQLMAREIAPGNRLFEQYQTANSAGVTWAVDPAIVAKEAAQNTAPILQTSTDQKPKPASPEELTAVADWQTKIIGGTGRPGIASLPYLDPDIAALTAAGHTNAAHKSVTLGNHIWNEAQVETPPIIAWPHNEATNVPVTQLVTDAATMGANIFVAPPPPIKDRAATPSVALVDPNGDNTPQPGQTPDAPFATPSDGTMTALWPNPTVTNELNALHQASSYDSPFEACVSTSNRLASTTSSTLGLIMAEIALSGVETPQSENTQVVVFDRSWHGPPGAGATIVTHLLNAPWTQPTAAQDAAPTITGVAIPPSQVANFSNDNTNNTPTPPHWTTALTAVNDIELALSLLADPPHTYSDQVIAALASMAWRRDSQDWEQALTDLHTYTETALKAVTVEPGSSLNVLAEHVEIPVTIVNRFSEPARVSVRLTTTKRKPGLRPGDSQDITIPANTQQKVQFPVTALTNGEANVTAEVSTINGDTVTISDPVTIRIRKEVETRLLAWSSLALALLVAGGVFRSIRKSKGAPTPSAEQPTPPTPES